MKTGSLRGRLRWLIILVLAAVLLPLGVLSFQRTVSEVDELSDGRLAQNARTLEVLIRQSGIAALRKQDGHAVMVPTPEMPASTPRLRPHTFESEVGFQVFDGTGRIALATANLAELPRPSASDEGFRDLQTAHHLWRIYTLTDYEDGVVVRAGERYDSRHEIMHALWLDHGLPLLIGLPLLGLLTGWAVRRGLAPLASLASALTSRQPGSHAPIVLERAPLELQPVLAALNGQLSRLEEALERERRFSADVAHELRTPLSSTMINLESAMITSDPGEVAVGLASAHLSLATLVRRVEQLLDLSRLESGMRPSRPVRVDLISVAVAVIEELAPVMAESGVEIGFVRQCEHAVVQGYEAALTALLRNLIENALRHVPAGGLVQLSIETDARETRLDVIDDGPGIPAERRDEVFARFHRETTSRGDGYGLGLSIVQRAAQLHGASIELLDSPFGRGLRVRIVIPTLPAH